MKLFSTKKELLAVTLGIISCPLIYMLVNNSLLGIILDGSIFYMYTNIAYARHELTVAAVVTVIVVLPGYFLLRRFNLLKWYSSLITGFLLGYLTNYLYLQVFVPKYMDDAGYYPAYNIISGLAGSSSLTFAWYIWYGLYGRKKVVTTAQPRDPAA